MHFWCSMHMLLFGKNSHLTTRGSPVKYADKILRLLEADHLPTEVSVSHSKGHQKGSMEVASGNQSADQAANMNMKSLSNVRLFATPWTIACQASLSMGFSRQEYWSGLPFKEFPGKLVCGTEVSTPIKSLFCNAALSAA